MSDDLVGQVEDLVKSLNELLTKTTLNMSKADLEQLTEVCTSVSESTNQLVDSLTRKANSSKDPDQVDKIITGVNQLTQRVGDLVGAFIAFLKDNSQEDLRNQLKRRATDLASAVSPLLAGMGGHVAQDVKGATNRTRREAADLRHAATVSPDALLASARKVVQSVGDINRYVAVAQRAAENQGTRDSLARDLQSLKGISQDLIRAAQAMVRAPSDTSLPGKYDEEVAKLNKVLAALEDACDAEVSSSNKRVDTIRDRIESLLSSHQ